MGVDSKWVFTYHGGMVGDKVTHKKRLNAEERRLQIVASAVPLFAEKGFKATTTKDIAAAAGISEALMYKHFSSKEELYDELQQHCCVSGDEIGENLSLMEPGTQALVLTLYILVSMIIEGPPEEEEDIPHEFTKKLMIHSLTEDGQFARQFLEKRLLIWLPSFESFMQAAIDQGEVLPGISKGPFRIWLAHHLAFGIATFALPEEEVLEYDIAPEKIVDETCLFVLRGLGIKEELIKKYYDVNKFKRFLAPQE